MGQSESINILMDAGMEESKGGAGYQIPVDEDDSNVIDVTQKVPEKKSNPPNRNEGINQGFDATGGTSGGTGIDMDNMVNQVRNEDDKYLEEDEDNFIEDNYADD